MLAMDVNDDAGILIPRGVLECIASVLAPTVSTGATIRGAQGAVIFRRYH